jgi:hypothetical protein
MHPKMIEDIFFVDPCFLAVLQLLMTANGAEKIAPILDLIVEIRGILYPTMVYGRY